MSETRKYYWEHEHHKHICELAVGYTTKFGFNPIPSNTRAKITDIDNYINGPHARTTRTNTFVLKWCVRVI